MRNGVRQSLIGVLATATGATLAMVLVVAPGVAAAMSWAVAPEQSHVEFEYIRNGAPAEGRFGTFSGEGIFDPGAPGDATLELRIDSASIDLGETVASAFATSAEWFDSANHPQVVYRLVTLAPLGGNRYRAEGNLTIRGRTRPIETTIDLEISADGAHASGDLRLDRADFWLGVGPSALFVDIGHEVAVRFDLTAHPAH